MQCHERGDHIVIDTKSAEFRGNMLRPAPSRGTGPFIVVYALVKRRAARVQLDSSLLPMRGTVRVRARQSRTGVAV